MGYMSIILSLITFNETSFCELISGKIAHFVNKHYAKHILVMPYYKILQIRLFKVVPT